MKNTLIIFCILFLSAGFVYSEESIIPNAGQWPENILAKASADGINVWITGDGLVFDHYNIKPGLKSPGKYESNAHDTIIGCAYMLLFSSDNQRNKVINLNTNGEKPTVHNYFYDHKSNKAVSVKSYREITVDYQDFSLKLTIDSHKPRYDIILPPGANPGNLKIEFQGEGHLDYSDNGNFKVVSGNVEYTHGALKAFQKSEYQLQPIDCSPVIYDGKHLTFKLGKYDETEELIIDPTVFSTFLGGADASGLSICVNQDNNPVFGMYIFDKMYFPDSLKRYNIARGEVEGVVCCFDRDGKYPLWLSHFPEFMIHKIAFLNDGSYKLYGFSRDTMPVCDHAYLGNPDFSIRNDMYYSVNLSNTGDSLYNGSFWEIADGYFSHDFIEIDDKGNCYHVGSINENTNIFTTENAIRKEKKQKFDGFITILGANGSEIKFSSYYGRGKQTELMFCTLFEDTLCLSGVDVYSTEIDSAYYSLLDLSDYKTTLYQTYEELLRIQYVLYSGNNNFQIFGLTEKEDITTTPGAHKTTDTESGMVLFLIKKNILSGNEIISTYGQTYPYDMIQFDRTPDNCYIVSGTGQGGELDVTNDALTTTDSQFLGENRGFVMVISSKLDSVLYCSYLAGRGWFNELRGSAIDSTGRIYLSGMTESYDFPIYNAFDPHFPYQHDAGFICAIEYNPITSVEENPGH